MSERTKNYITAFCISSGRTWLNLRREWRQLPPEVSSALAGSEARCWGRRTASMTSLRCLQKDKCQVKTGYSAQLLTVENVFCNKHLDMEVVSFGLFKKRLTPTRVLDSTWEIWRCNTPCNFGFMKTRTTEGKIDEKNTGRISDAWE